MPGKRFGKLLYHKHCNGCKKLFTSKSPPQAKVSMTVYDDYMSGLNRMIVKLVWCESCFGRIMTASLNLQDPPHDEPPVHPEAS